MMSAPGSKSRPLESLITISTDQVGPCLLSPDHGSLLFQRTDTIPAFYFQEPHYSCVVLRNIRRNRPGRFSHDESWRRDYGRLGLLELGRRRRRARGHVHGVAARGAGSHPARSELHGEIVQRVLRRAWTDDWVEAAYLGRETTAFARSRIKDKGVRS